MLRLVFLAMIVLVPIAAAAPDAICTPPGRAFACASDASYGNTPFCPAPHEGRHGFTGVEAAAPGIVAAGAGGYDTECRWNDGRSHDGEGTFVRASWEGGAPIQPLFVNWYNQDEGYGRQCGIHAQVSGDNMFFACPVGTPPPNPGWGRLLAPPS